MSGSAGYRTVRRRTARRPNGGADAGAEAEAGAFAGEAAYRRLQISSEKVTEENVDFNQWHIVAPQVLLFPVPSPTLPAVPTPIAATQVV